MELTVIKTQHIEIKRYQLYTEDGRFFEIERKHNYMDGSIGFDICQQNPYERLLPGNPDHYIVMNQIKKELENGI